MWAARAPWRPPTGELAASPLTTPTYDGSGQAVHPDVVDAGAGGWNGYRYWMAMTPYPGADLTYENPSILASTDGTTWVVPDGLTNPVEPAPATGYHSDPDIVLHGGTMHLFWRAAFDLNTNFEHIYLRTSTDGVTWTPKVTLITSDVDVTRPVSPAVVHNSGEWVMWAVDIIPTVSVVKRWTADAPEGPWTAAGSTDLLAPSGKRLWHLDVAMNGSEYLALVNVNDPGGSANGQLYLARSRDGLRWDRSLTPCLTFGTTWQASLYRSCLVAAGAGTWDVWYSAHNAAATEYRTGRTSISTA